MRNVWIFLLLALGFAQLFKMVIWSSFVPGRAISEDKVDKHIFNRPHNPYKKNTGSFTLKGPAF